VKRKLMCLLFVFVFSLSPCLNAKVKAAMGNNVHNVNTGISYTTIQNAVNAKETLDGNTITVEAGTYFEHIVLNKTLNIIGENSDTTIIDGQHTGTVVTVEANNVKINGFTVQNSGNNSQSPMLPLDCGIKLSASSTLPQNATVENNKIINNGCGILAQYSNNDTIVNNAFSNNFGIFSWRFILNFTTGQFEKVTEGSENDIFVLASNGSLLENDQGIGRIYNSTANTILNCSGQILLTSSQENMIASSSCSISLSSSNNNTLTYCSGPISLSSSEDNTVSHCSHGFKLVASNHNVIADNELLPGESIEIPDQTNYTAISSCERNTLINNTLTNGTIYIGLLTGPQLIAANKNTITNNTLTGGGIHIIGSNNSITQNKISGATEGIQIRAYQTTNGVIAQSRDNIISKNSLVNNDVGLLISSSNNEATENVIANNTLGLNLGGTENTLKDNRLSGNTWNLEVGNPGKNHIDATNTVNGDPIYCIVNSKNIQVSPSNYPRVGYLALTDCSDINVQGLHLSGNVDGIILNNCSNCTIQQNTIKNSLVAIHFASSDYITVANNIITENCMGIDLEGAHNKIENNIIMNNTIRLVPYWFPENWPRSFNDPIKEWLNQGTGMYSGGICMFGAQNSTISGNTITHNELGIFMYASSFNVFRNNKMADNFQNFGIDPTHLYPFEWGIMTPFPNETSPYVANDVDASNTINGRPICWWINQNNKQVPENSGYVFLVNCTNMTIKNLKLQNDIEGMLLYGVKNTVISDNTIIGCSYGIRILPYQGTYPEYTSNDTLCSNRITANGVGLSIIAGNCTISHNQIDKNILGIDIRGVSNIIFENSITNNTYPPKDQWILGYQPAFLATEYYLYPSGSGIVFEGSNNTACYNTIENNDVGITSSIITSSGGNWVFQNNFISNIYQTDLCSINKWNAEYPMGGNYWSSYTGADVFSGPFQNLTGSDAIGDARFRATEIVEPRRLTPQQAQMLLEQYDGYPLLGPVSIFDVGVWNGTSYSVAVVSNSTLSDFVFDPVSTGPYLGFTVTGEVGTTGFCRVAIPKKLLWAYDNWTIKIGGRSVEYAIIPDADTTYLMFNYSHSTRTVQIIGTHAIEEHEPFPVSFITVITIMSSSVIMALLILLHGIRKKASSRTSSDSKKQNPKQTSSFRL
jgi:parallel beta-helix repeat protein